jgi:uncharacterized protein (UPF0179 family)
MCMRLELFERHRNVRVARNSFGSRCIVSCRSEFSVTVLSASVAGMLSAKRKIEGDRRLS